MSSEASLRCLRESHQRLRFPDELVGLEVDGECLLLLDGAMAGCIHGFFSGHKHPGLDANRLRILAEGAAHLARVCPQLSAEFHPYFESLRTLAKGIVRYCRREQ